MKLEERFAPVKRTALDGKRWWVVWDVEKNGYSTLIFHGKYKTKSDCQFYIARSVNEMRSYLNNA